MQDIVFPRHVARRGVCLLQLRLQAGVGVAGAGAIHVRPVFPVGHRRLLAESLELVPEVAERRSRFLLFGGECSAEVRHLSREAGALLVRGGPIRPLRERTCHLAVGLEAGFFDVVGMLHPLPLQRLKAALALVGRGVDRALEARPLHLEELLEAAGVAVQRSVRRVLPGRGQLPLDPLLFPSQVRDLLRLLLGGGLVALVLQQRSTHQLLGGGELLLEALLRGRRPLHHRLQLPDLIGLPGELLSQGARGCPAARVRRCQPILEVVALVAFAAEDRRGRHHRQHLGLDVIEWSPVGRPRGVRLLPDCCETPRGRTVRILGRGLGRRLGRGAGRHECTQRVAPSTH
mmetsp:Transcript_23883/g.56980  ORF Transcript_23883/g.56980 Transcript_23883/m.56980 type:complete len:346 (+) Transcript_23883:348-1385(+)